MLASAPACESVQSFVTLPGLPFATMLADKSALEERQAAYLGIYDGRLMDNRCGASSSRATGFCSIGAMMTDFNTGAFTARLDPGKTIDIGHHRTRVGANVYPNVEMKDLLAELTRRIARRGGRTRVQPVSLGPAAEAATSRSRPRAFISAGKTS